MTTQTRKHKIVFSDGRRGTQTEFLRKDGVWELSEIVVTQEANGRRCNHVYGPKSFVQDRVYSFADLGNVTWEIAE